MTVVLLLIAAAGKGTSVFDCLHVDKRDAARTIRSLNVDFQLPYGNAGTQRIGHGSLMVGLHPPLLRFSRVCAGRNETCRKVRCSLHCNSPGQESCLQSRTFKASRTVPYGTRCRI